MIIKTYTEEETLAELLKDYAYIKRQAKKLADKHLKAAQKQGRYIRQMEVQRFLINTSNNNKWCVVITYCQKSKVAWQMQACCIVESGKTRKYYYILRGLSNNKPYYIRLSSHTLKRYRERFYNLVQGTPLEELACYVFYHREKAVCKRYMDVRKDRLFVDADDAFSIEGMKYLVFTLKGCYIAKRTKGGNFIFLTYLSPQMCSHLEMEKNKNRKEKWNIEASLSDQMFMLHLYYNKAIYGEKLQREIIHPLIGKGVTMIPRYRNSVLLLEQ